MKFSKIKSIMEKHDYVLLRNRANNMLIGFNCKVAVHREKQVAYDPNAESIFISYYPCTFMEYISHKVAFK